MKLTHLFFTICALLGPAACAASEDDDARAGENLRGEDGSDDGKADGQTRGRVCAQGATTLGIDVSKWDGTVNWPRVKAAGVYFAFVRVSDGTNTRDAQFATNWAGAKTAGVIRGAYQFFRPTQSVTTQADMMISAIGTYQAGDLPPVIDVEDAGGLGAATVASRVRAWVDRVQAALGVTPIVYTGKYFWRDQVGGPASFAPNPLWIAQYTSLCPDLPAPWTRWTFWQYTETGRIDGIDTAVDINRFNGSPDQLLDFVGKPTQPLPFSWVRNADASYDFSVTAPSDIAKVELRVEDYLIGTAPISNGAGALHYVFNVSKANRVIEARGLSASGATAALGNGIIDSLATTSAFLRQTGEHEYEIGLERAPAGWATVEINVDGFLLTDIDTGLQRSPRLAVRWKFNGLGNRNIEIIARDANGAVVDTRTRVLLVR